MVKKNYFHPSCVCFKLYRTMLNPLRLYYAQRIKNIFNHLHDFELKGDEVSMHDLRVEMKKFSALIRFLRTVYPKQKLKKAAHYINSVFHESGDIREFQILHQWLLKNEYKGLESNYFPESKLKEMSKDFQLKSKKYRREFKETMDDINKFIEATNHILVEQYLVEVHARIEKLTSNHAETEYWHELRKYIKQWLYANNWVDSSKNKHRDDLPYYNKLQECIGLWHDAEVIKEMLLSKQIKFSVDIEIQKEFTSACAKLNRSIRYRERQIGKLLSAVEAN